MVGLGPSGGCGWLAGEDVGRKEDVACVDGGGGEDIVVRRRVVFVALALGDGSVSRGLVIHQLRLRVDNEAVACIIISTKTQECFVFSRCYVTINSFSISRVCMHR